MAKKKKKITKKVRQKKPHLNLKTQISIGRVTLVQKALFAKHMSVMLKAGLNVVEALEIAVDEAQGKFKKILASIFKSIQSGNSFNASLARYPKVFSLFFINSVRVGEKSGGLEENFEYIASQLEKDQKLISKIRGALIYPIVVLSASFVLGFFVTFFVFPQIIPMFSGLNIDLPLSTRILIAISTFVRDYSQILIISIIGFILLIIFLVRQKFSHPVTHWMLLHIPVLKNISKNTNLARFSRTVGMLLKSGLNIDEALLITSRTLNNYYYKKYLRKVVNHVQMGGQLSETFRSNENLFPKLVINMIKTGEESGSLEETLLYLSEFHEFEIDNSVKTLSTVIEPILLLLIGVVVAGLAMAVITPIYQITGNVTP